MYTLMARIAPSWNKVGEFLIGGRQFLHQGGHLPAVKLRLHLANSRVEITLQASLVRFPLLQPDDLGIDIAVLEQFILGSEQCLTQENFGRRSVLVLPRLTKAFLLSVTKQLPKDADFRIGMESRGTGRTCTATDLGLMRFQNQQYTTMFALEVDNLSPTLNGPCAEVLPRLCPGLIQGLLRLSS